MKHLETQEKDIFTLASQNFEEVALSVFKYQYKNNKVYNQFVRQLGIDPAQVQSLTDIPFLPIEFFKTHRVVTASSNIDKIFESSGTTTQQRSRHYVADLDLYEKSLVKYFQKCYGPAEQYCLLALLPSYLERENASLVYMTRVLIEQTQCKESGFFLHDQQNLVETIQKVQKKEKRKILLLGVSFALWEMAEKHPIDLSDAIIMETGGMKGKRKELVREELHYILKKSFQVQHIHSEYGMTELLSQAYARKGGRFKTPNWMKVMIRDIYDPLSYVDTEQTGAINVIDLANIHSCAFIATKDLGRLKNDGCFEVLGRLDSSDIRGCNLMVS